MKLRIEFTEHKGKFTQGRQRTAALITQAGSKQNVESNVIEKSCCDKSNSTWPLRLKGKDIEGPTEQKTAQSQKVRELREYMHWQVLERKRRERHIRRKVEFEQQRKRRNVQDVVKKQKEALLRPRKQQIHKSEVRIDATPNPAAVITTVLNYSWIQELNCCCQGTCC